MNLLQSRCDMTAALYPTVVGVFMESGQASGAVEALRHAGFSEPQIAVTTSPSEEEDGQERTLVTVRANGRHEEVVDILKAHGAYGKGSPLV